MQKTDQEGYREHYQQAVDVVLADDTTTANRLSLDLESYVKKKGFRRNDQELFQKYTDLIHKLKWIALPLLRKSEILTLFESNFQDALGLPFFSVEEKMRQTLLSIFDIDERDEIKKALKEILNRNQAALTKVKLKNGKNGTVENWIRDYVSQIGVGRIDSIKFQNYFLGSENFRSLDDKEKDRVKNILHFYESLKLSSKTIEGLEDSVLVEGNGFVGILSGGSLNKIRPSKEQERIAAVVQEVFKERSEEDAKKKTQENNDKNGGVSKEKPVEKPLSPEEKQALEEKKRREEKRQAKLLELEKMLETYPKGSFERKVIEEEIKKI